MLLGCIGDDFTGSSDLANTLAREGMRTMQFTGVPAGDAPADCEAGVVALKSRSIPAADAVARSLAALDWLKRQGCEQFLFKYCSTFDSTPEGNIGPVAEALAAALGAKAAVVCPVFPATGRTLYAGHLFVNGRLLSESGMEKHPLTPMTDPDIRRFLRRQTRGEVGLVTYATVDLGPAAIRKALDEAAARGETLVVVDAVKERHLRDIGAAIVADRLITGGSGIALGLPANFRAAGRIAGAAGDWRGEAGPAAALAGSCSGATRAQVARHLAAHPGLRVEADAVMSGALGLAEALAFVRAHAGGLPLVYSSADPADVAAAQARHGREAVAERLESFFADLAVALVDAGVRRLVVAGGETSGAVATALARPAFEIGPEIDPGVPALRAAGAPPLTLALKSGNFGAEDFFEKAFRALAG
ncbi:MAG: four-carbon acid sugar kinase family protein [Methylobacteriaceae bacterium]|nr:four-carbon acid sugar kinase family protein [Methylobacteriaceae bacterium]